MLVRDVNRQARRLCPEDQVGYSFIIQGRWWWWGGYLPLVVCSSMVYSKKVFDPKGHTRTVMALIQISGRVILKLLPLV